MKIFREKDHHLVVTLRKLLESSNEELIDQVAATTRKELDSTLEQLLQVGGLFVPEPGLVARLKVGLVKKFRNLLEEEDHETLVLLALGAITHQKVLRLQKEISLAAMQMTAEENPDSGLSNLQ